MKTFFNNSKSVVRIATVMALFGFLAFAGETARAQQGKTISAGPGPMPKVDRDDKHRRRGTFVQNGAAPSAHGGAGMPSTNMFNNKYPEEMQYEFNQRRTSITSGSSGTGNSDPFKSRRASGQGNFHDGFETGDSSLLAGTYGRGLSSNYSFGAPNRPNGEMGFKTTVGNSSSISGTVGNRREVAVGDVNSDGIDYAVQSKTKQALDHIGDFNFTADNGVPSEMGMSLRGTTRHRPMTLNGQDQVTGEIITYPDVLKSKRRK